MSVNLSARQFRDPNLLARIRQGLEACAWNRTQASEWLGLPLRTLVGKIKSYDIQRSR